MTPWEHRARCRGAPPDLFFEDTPSNEREARKLCAVCPVREECLADAMYYTVEFMKDGDSHLDSGLYGGLNVAERQELARRNGLA